MCVTHCGNKQGALQLYRSRFKAYASALELDVDKKERQGLWYQIIEGNDEIQTLI